MQLILEEDRLLGFRVAGSVIYGPEGLLIYTISSRAPYQNYVMYKKPNVLIFQAVVFGSALQRVWSCTIHFTNTDSRATEMLVSGLPPRVVDWLACRGPSTVGQMLAQLTDANSHQLPSKNGRIWPSRSLLSTPACKS